MSIKANVSVLTNDYKFHFTKKDIELLVKDMPEDNIVIMPVLGFVDSNMVVSCPSEALDFVYNHLPELHDYSTDRLFWNGHQIVGFDLPESDSTK